MLEELVSRIDGKPASRAAISLRVREEAVGGPGLALTLAGCCPHSACGSWLPQGRAVHSSGQPPGAQASPLPFY